MSIIISNEIDDSSIIISNEINDDCTIISNDLIAATGAVTKPQLDAFNVAYTNAENVFTEVQELAKEKGFYTAPSGVQRYQITQDGNNMTILGLAANGDELQPAMVFNINNGFLSADGLDLGHSLGKWKEVFLSSYANVLGIKSVENDPAKVFATDGRVVTNGGALPSNVALTDEENVFTADQTILTKVKIGATSSRIELSSSGSNLFILLKDATTTLGTLVLSGDTNKFLAMFDDGEYDLGFTNLK